MTANRRELFRVNLHGLYLPKYDALCQALPDNWQPFFGYRTIEESNLLYDQGRSAPGKIVTKAKGGFSAHNYGCASDWTIFDEQGIPQWLEHDDPQWAEYRDACRKSGLYWGGTFVQFPDWPHNEGFIKGSWGDVGRCFCKDGLEAAKAMVEQIWIK